MAKSILQDIIKMTTKMIAMQAISGMFGGGMGGGIGGMLSGAFGLHAKGGQFMNGVEMHAKGGIIDQPQMFSDRSGGMHVAGEAGSELIAPIKKNSKGEFGVGAVAPKIVFNNYGEPLDIQSKTVGDTVFLTAKRKKDINEFISEQIVRGHGQVASTFEKNYGLQRVR